MVQSADPVIAAAAPRPCHVALVWEHFGPMHHDRLEAMNRAGIPAVGIQLFANSRVYRSAESEIRHPVTSLAAKRINPVRLAWRLVRAIESSGARQIFLCHYEYPAVAIAAFVLRAKGYRIFAMTDSKHDDYERSAWTGPVKRCLLSAYHGALTAGQRSADYLVDHGLARGSVALGYDTIDTRGFASLGEEAAQPAFDERPFLIVARLVAKKNLAMAIRAFAALGNLSPGRRLKIVGYGPLEGELAELARQLCVAKRVEFSGALDRREVSRAMHEALALILPSSEEQWGLVINEALACGLPVLVSRNAGAVDALVDHGENGYVFAAHDEAALIDAMGRIASDEGHHAALSAAARKASPRGDVNHFVAGVRQLTEHALQVPSQADVKKPHSSQRMTQGFQRNSIQS